MYYILYYYNKISYRKGNIINKIIRKRKCICSFTEENSHVRELVHFKPMPFKDQLYFIAFFSDSNSKWTDGFLPLCKYTAKHLKLLFAVI